MKQSKMIESRYSIEYIDPHYEKSPLKLGKLLIYSTLTISILAAVIAFTYSKLPNNTTQLVTQKIQQFISSFNQPSAPVNLPVEKISVSDSGVPSVTKEKRIQGKEELNQNKLSAIQIEKEYKKEIERLNQENTNQKNETLKQLTINQALTKRLDVLSTQLEEETLKNTQLGKEVASLQSKNKSISSLLKISEEMANSYSAELNKLDQKQKVKSYIATTHQIEKPSKIDVKLKMATTTNVEEKLNSSIIKNKKEISQLDAIVATMESIKNNTKNNEDNNHSSVIE